MINLIYRVLLALTLTIFIELCVAISMGYRKRRDLECIILVNLITNPIFNYFLICYYLLTNSNLHMLYIIILEILIVFIEYLLLKKAMNYKNSKILLLSFFMNSVSYLSGTIIKT